MPKNAVLFIPDISGFTEFVEHTSISHSQHIIAELLELLLDSNIIGLELAEIEGDALFMYKLIDEVDEEEIIKQAEHMFYAFHKHLKRYEHERICRCGACSSAYNLNLKFVIHFGEIDFITVKSIKKPYGKEVIKVHRLLKNAVPIKEYALLTENITALNEDEKVIENYDFGKVTYYYKDLSHLKTQIPYEIPKPHKPPKHQLLNLKAELNLPILEAYELISNFDYRLLWLQGVDKLDYEKNKINRQGQKHNCLVSDGSSVEPTTVSFKNEADDLIYGEVTNDVPLIKRLGVYYLLKVINAETTQLNVSTYADFKPLAIVMKPFVASKLKKNFNLNVSQLKQLIDAGNWKS